MNKLIMFMCLMLSAFTLTIQAQQKVSDNQNNRSMENNTIKLTVEGGKSFTATLEENSSAKALKKQPASQ